MKVCSIYWKLSFKPNLQMYLVNFTSIKLEFLGDVATNEGEHRNVIVYTNYLRFCYSVNVSLIVLRFCSLICYGSLIVVCKAIATLVFCLYGCVRFTICYSEVITLNVFENIFETSLENTQNKTTVIYLLFATIRYFWSASVYKSPNFSALNVSYLLS